MTAVMAGTPRGRPTLPDDGVDYQRGAADSGHPFRVPFSPRLGDFPVDAQVATVVRSAVETLRGTGIEIDEVELDFKTGHDELARFWVRVISVHYVAIAHHWKAEGTDLLGEHRSKLTPQFRQMMIDAQKISAVDHALDDVLRTDVFGGLQAVFDNYDLIVSPTLAIPPVANATDGNTIGPTEINGDSVDPLIGWCMTFPINFTGHSAISVPAGLTVEGLPVGLQIIGRRYADESVLALASRFEHARPWLRTYPGLVSGTGRTTHASIGSCIRSRTAPALQHSNAAVHAPRLKSRQRSVEVGRQSRTRASIAAITLPRATTSPGMGPKPIKIGALSASANGPGGIVPSTVFTAHYLVNGWTRIQ